MSRIGNKPIKVPTGVQVTITADEIKVKGPKGELKHVLFPEIKILLNEDILKVKRVGDEPKERSLHGLTRAFLNNMIKGVTTGFEKRLEIIGVGYRAQISGKKVTLNLGFSHPIEMECPAGVTAEMDKEQKNTMIITGIDKQVVGQFAANIRALKKPEPYKGKGIKYSDEVIARKAGKAAAAAGSKE